MAHSFGPDFFTNHESEIIDYLKLLIERDKSRPENGEEAPNVSMDSEPIMSVYTVIKKACTTLNSDSPSMDDLTQTLSYVEPADRENLINTLSKPTSFHSGHSSEGDSVFKPAPLEEFHMKLNLAHETCSLNEIGMDLLESAHNFSKPDDSYLQKQATFTHDMIEHFKKCKKLEFGQESSFMLQNIQSMSDQIATRIVSTTDARAIETHSKIAIDTRLQDELDSHCIESSKRVSERLPVFNSSPVELSSFMTDARSKKGALSRNQFLSVLKKNKHATFSSTARKFPEHFWDTFKTYVHENEDKTLIFEDDVFMVTDLSLLQDKISNFCEFTEVTLSAKQQKLLFDTLARSVSVEITDQNSFLDSMRCLSVEHQFSQETMQNFVAYCGFVPDGKDIQGSLATA